MVACMYWFIDCAGETPSSVPFFDLGEEAGRFGEANNGNRRVQLGSKFRYGDEDYDQVWVRALSLHCAVCVIALSHNRLLHGF